MAKMVFGDEFVDQNCVMINLINANSPLVFDGTMVGALKVYARNNQATVISPFILSGAMSAVTVVGTLTQILAEASRRHGLRAALPARVRRWCSAPSPARSRCSRARRPSARRSRRIVLFGAAQLARRLGVPFRSGGGLCASKLPDAQAAHESCQHAVADAAGRGQFRAACGGLARRRPRVGLREVHHRRRPAHHVPALRRRRRFLGERPGADRPSAKSARARISSAAPTRRPISRRPSGGRRSPTTTPSSSGATTAARMRRSGPTTPGSGSSANMKRRRIDPAQDEALHAYMAKRKETAARHFA